ncbi:type 4a pilus biogenesis protein PilO [Angustibacter aerolatus]
MTSTRTWSLGAAVLALLLVVAAWFLLISPQRSQAAELRSQTAQQRDHNQSIELKTAQLKAQYASLSDREKDLAVIRRQLPDSAALPSLIRDLSVQAGVAGVDLVSVTPAAPTPYTPGAAAGAATTTAAAPATGLQAIQTGVVASGTYAELNLYLMKLQKSIARAYLLDTVSLAPLDGAASTSDQLQMTLSGKIFVLASDAVSTTTTSTGASAPAGSAS